MNKLITYVLYVRDTIKEQTTWGSIEQTDTQLLNKLCKFRLVSVGAKLVCKLVDVVFTKSIV